MKTIRYDGISNRVWATTIIVVVTNTVLVLVSGSCYVVGALFNTMKNRRHLRPVQLTYRHNMHRHTQTLKHTEIRFFQ